MFKQILLTLMVFISLVTNANSTVIPLELQGKTITIVVPYGPGGNSDLVARQLAQQVSFNTGIKTVVLNKPGAGGSIAAAYVAESKPDGLTLCQCETGPAFFNKIIGIPGSPNKDDLIPISSSMESVLAIAVIGNSKINNIKDLAQYLNDNPKTASYATTGSVSLAWSTEILSIAKVNGIPPILYKSQAEAITSVMSGVTTFLIGGIGDMIKLSEAGKLKILVVGSNNRVPLLPAIPTLRESFAPLTYTNLNGIYAPKNTPLNIQEYLNTIWSDAVWSASTIAFFHARGILPIGGDLSRAKLIHNTYYKSREALYGKYQVEIMGK